VHIGQHYQQSCLVLLLVCVQVGVKQGGCSGMSYVMDFEQPDNIKDDDYVIEYEGGAFKLACDPKSLL
jgi:iron-sulfur cluster assembly protein